MQKTDMKNVSHEHEKKFRFTLRKVGIVAPSLLFSVVCIAIFIGYSKIHGYQFGQISILKLSALAGIAAMLLYAVLSLLSQRLCRLNNLVLVNLLITLVGAEAILHVMEDALPFSIVEMLPKDDRERLMKNRGMFVANAISGDGMLYAWKPKGVLSSLPWVEIDANGYRNPTISQSVDVVLLGDSVTISPNSDRDMADILRAKGVSALNLGFGGYGPYHQRDAYQKYVLSADISHDIVLINFCFCNDVTDAQAYEQLLRRGGTWRDYLGTTPSKNAFPFDFDPPWTISILFHLPYKAVQAYRDKKTKAENMVLSLPRGAVQVAGWHLPTEPKYFEADWKPTLTALADIMRRAKSVGSEVILAYYPNLLQIYMQHLPPSTPIKNAAQHDYNDAVARLSHLARREEAMFIDYTEPMQEGNAKALVTESESDYHPNSRGVEIMVETAFPVIRKLLGLRELSSPSIISNERVPAP